MCHLQASLHFLPPETTTKCFGNSHIHTHTLWIQKMQILLNHFAVHSWKMHLQNYSLDFQYDSNYDLYAFCHQNYHKSVPVGPPGHTLNILKKLWPCWAPISPSPPPNKMKKTCLAVVIGFYMYIYLELNKAITFSKCLMCGQKGGPVGPPGHTLNILKKLWPCWAPISPNKIKKNHAGAWLSTVIVWLLSLIYWADNCW